MASGPHLTVAGLNLIYRPQKSGISGLLLLRGGAGMGIKMEMGMGVEMGMEFLMGKGMALGLEI